jgi:hypothetical protein
MTKRVVGDVAGAPVSNANDRLGECDDEASKHNPQGGQVVKLRAPEWLCDAHDRAGDQKVETNETRTLPPLPDGHNVRLDDDQPHGPDPPHCAMRSTPAHLQPPSARQVPAASCSPPTIPLPLGVDLPVESRLLLSHVPSRIARSLLRHRG